VATCVERFWNWGIYCAVLLLSCRQRNVRARTASAAEREDLCFTFGRNDRLCRLQGGTEHLCSNRAGELYEQGKVEEAVQLYREAIQANPEFAAAHCGLGNALRKLAKLDEAIASYQRSVDLEPTYIRCRYPLAILLFERSRYDEAGREFSILEQNSNICESKVYLAVIAEAEGRIVDARNLFSSAHPQCISRVPRAAAAHRAGRIDSATELRRPERHLYARHRGRLELAKLTPALEEARDVCYPALRICSSTGQVGKVDKATFEDMLDKAIEDEMTIRKECKLAKRLREAREVQKTPLRKEQRGK
jgi:tetratricopeptide (TPR) repeat protein